MLYYSYRTRKSLADKKAFLPFGSAHYSYGSVCQKFASTFLKHDLPMSEILMPEIYPNADQLTPYHEGRRAVHILFKPFEEIRLLKGAINIAHVAWEFNKLPTLDLLPIPHKKRHNPCNDYVHMLRLPSEVWVGSEFTKKRLEQHGIRNVQLVPAPIEAHVHSSAREARLSPLRAVNFLELTRAIVLQLADGVGALPFGRDLTFRAEECRDAGGRIFLSVFNPGDARKNAAALIFGFQQFIGSSDRNDLLIIKLITHGGVQSLREAFSTLLPRYFEYSGLPFSFVDCKNILVVFETLDSSEMSSLYQLADFYLCTSGAEGQGLPVLEAMAAGVPPISSRETAMADYINEDNAVVMQTNERVIPLQIAESYSLSDVTWRLPDHKHVAQGLLNATQLSQAGYKKKSEQARKTIDEHYSVNAIMEIVRKRLAIVSRW